MLSVRRVGFVAFSTLFLTVGTLRIPRVACAAERGLTLDQLVKLSLDGPQLRAAREAINQARADRETASLVPNPQLSVSVGLLPLSRRYTVEQPGGPSEVAAGTSYPIDWLLFGKRSAAMASANLGIRVAQAEYEDTVRRRVADTVDAYWTVLETEALLTVSTQSVDCLKQAEAAIQTAVAGGGRTPIELDRMRLELYSAKREQRLAELAALSAKSTLGALLGGRNPATQLEVCGTLDGPLDTRPLAVDAAFGIAAERRPDIVALRWRAAQAKAGQTVEQRNAWPETTVGVEAVHQFQHAIGARDVTAWGASIEFGLPVFDRNQGNRAKAASLSFQADQELTLGLRKLYSEIEQVVESLSVALENATGLGETELQLAFRVGTSLRQAYAAGGGTLIDMLDAQRSYRETHRAYISARADYRRALGRYHAALGRLVMS